MKQIKKSDLNLIIAVIALLLTAAAISAAIVYVNRTPEVYPSDREAVYEQSRQGQRKSALRHMLLLRS